MSCLSVLVGRIAKYLNVSCKIASETTRVSLLLDPGNLSISCNIVPDTTSISISRIPSDLNVSCGIVCSLSDVFYLVVSPDEPQWITDDMGVDFRVESNVDWIVETALPFEILAFLGNDTLISNDVMLSNWRASDVMPIVLLRNDKYIHNGILYKNE